MSDYNCESITVRALLYEQENADKFLWEGAYTVKILLAGPFGHLGQEILKRLIADGHEVVGLGRNSNKEMEEFDNFTFVKANLMDSDSIKGCCKGCDMVISTVGLTKASAVVNAYDVDYKGNMNLLKEAKESNVKKFIFISVVHADEHKEIPLLDAKARFEKELMASGIDYLIYRPSGYFYDIVHVLKPMVEKGVITLLGKKSGVCNVIDTRDLAQYIVENLDFNESKIISIGGKEIYDYDEIAKMCFDAAKKPCVVKKAPRFLFDILILINDIKKTGKADIIRFSKFTLTADLVGEQKVGSHSFKEYIEEEFSLI